MNPFKKNTIKKIKFGGSSVDDLSRDTERFMDDSRARIIQPNNVN